MREQCLVTRTRHFFLIEYTTDKGVREVILFPAQKWLIQPIYALKKSMGSPSFGEWLLLSPRIDTVDCVVTFSCIAPKTLGRDLWDPMAHRKNKCE